MNLYIKGREFLCRMMLGISADPDRQVKYGGKSNSDIKQHVEAVPSLYNTPPKDSTRRTTGSVFWNSREGF